MEAHLGIAAWGGVDGRILLFELTALAVFAACLHHAWRLGLEGPRGRAWRVGEIAGVFLFGLASEWVNLAALHAYRFGEFALMVGPVPFAIPALWASIVYCAMRVTDRWGLPVVARPFADALLALLADVGSEVVAVRVGMWTWAIHPATENAVLAEWWGAPYVNFVGWMIVAGTSSACIRLARRAATRWADRPSAARALRGLAIPLGVALCEGILYLANSHGFAATRAGEETAVPLVLLLALAIAVVAVAARRARMPRPPDGLVFAVSIAGHLCVLAMQATPVSDPLPAWVPISSAVFVLGMSAGWVLAHRQDLRAHEALVSAPIRARDGSVAGEPAPPARET